MLLAVPSRRWRCLTRGSSLAKRHMMIGEPCKNLMDEGERPGIKFLALDMED